MNNTNDDDSYTFLVEWYDSVADLARKYNLRYWPKDCSLSMYDIIKNRLFLKRVINKDINFPNDLYIGKNIVIYSRQLKIIDYADTFTKNKFDTISNKYNILFANITSFTQFLNTIYTKYNKISFDINNIKSVQSHEKIEKLLNVEQLIYLFSFLFIFPDSYK